VEEGELSLDVLNDALRKSTDQGAQFTSAGFTDELKAASVRISMDGRGSRLDNVFIERLCRSLKSEEIHPSAALRLRDALLWSHVSRVRRSWRSRSHLASYEKLHSPVVRA
jgi:transposase InsO family protein